MWCMFSDVCCRPVCAPVRFSAATVSNEIMIYAEFYGHPPCGWTDAFISRRPSMAPLMKIQMSDAQGLKLSIEVKYQLSR